MDKFDRIFELHTLLAAHRHPVSLQSIQQKLECAESTARRALNTLRVTLGAPVEYDRERNGWYYDHTQGQPFELPGLWFSAEELNALMVSHNLLANLHPDILSSHIRPIKQRIENILKHQHAGSPDIARRIRIFQQAARPTDLDQFRRIAGATLERRQLRILYHGRERDQTSERTISPQRLTYYRSNWYLDAWCHLRQDLRTFSLDRTHVVEVNDTPAEDIADAILDAHFAHTYGIFAGPPKHTAILRFSPSASRWVADEHWHPDQQGNVLPDGSYELHIPYSDPRELVMDILKYGEEVEVLAPEELRDATRQRIRAALDKYNSPNTNMSA
jgi:predicted DNA-binding transcriptional regulator YafY